jgi:hypothetical protein
MFDEWRREQFIRKTLRRLSRQRVRGILPGNILVVENAVGEESEEVAEALRTCDLRGWVMVKREGVPHEWVTPDGHLADDTAATRVGPVWGLTEAGWNVIHRSHEWVLATFAVASSTLIATIVGIFIT